MPDTIGAAEFKAKCLKLMDEVALSGKPLTVTKNGRPMVRVVPAERKRSVFGLHQGRMHIVGDIASPATDLEEWEVER